MMKIIRSCNAERIIWNFKLNHCVKSVRIRSYSGPYISGFGLNTERYKVSLRIQSECGKIRTRITPNMDTFHAVNDPHEMLPNRSIVRFFSAYIRTFE